MKYLIAIIASLFVVTTNVAQNIEVKQTGFKNSFGKLQVPSPNHVYILDDMPSTFLSSTDGGATWDSLALVSDSVYYRYDGMQFLNENVGYMWGVAGCNYTFGTKPCIIKTTDKGRHWTIVNNNLPERAVFTQVKFFDELNGICFVPCIEHSGHPEKYYTENGGQTWETKNNFSYLYGDITKIEFIDELNGFATGINNNLFFSKTEDGGLTWYSNVLSTMSGGGTGVKFFSPTNGILVANDSIFMTFDAGDTWTKYKFPYSFNISAFDFAADGTGYFVSDNNIYSTHDKCVTWQLVYTSNNIYFADIKISGDVVYVTGTDGNVLKVKLDNTTSSVNNALNTNINIYPNPNDGNAKVTYYLEANAHVSVDVFTIMGQHVSTLVDETSAAGKYSYPLDITNLSAGVYMLKSNIDGINKTTKFVKYK